MNSAVPVPPPPETLASRQEKTTPHAPSWWVLLARDRATQILFVLVVVTNVTLLAYLWLRFDALPDLLPMHFDATGMADRIETKSNIFILPLIGLVVMSMNTVLGVVLHRRERAATLLLMTGAWLVQILLWVALSNIVGRLL